MKAVSRGEKRHLLPRAAKRGLADPRRGSASVRGDRVPVPGGRHGAGRKRLWRGWKLETLDLPEGLTTIGQDACSACEQLREARLPSTLKEIGRYVFHETLRPVKKLERLDIPEGVTKIGDYAFGCRPRLTGIFQPL